MDLLATTPPWTYWLAIPLTVGGVIGVLFVIVQYLIKAVAPKYPKQ